MAEDDIAKALAARKAAVLALEQEIRERFASQGESFYSSLIDDLSSRDYKIRRNAIEALGILGDKRAVKPLLAILEELFHTENGIGHSRSAIHALGKIGDPEAIPLLVKVFTKSREKSTSYPDPDWALAAIGAPVIPFLKQIIANPLYIRRAAAILARIGKAGEEEIISIFSQADTEIRTEVVFGVGDSRNGDLVPFIQNVLRDVTDKKIRYAAIYALRNIQTPLAIEILYRLLDSKMIEDRGAAIQALGWIKDKAAVPRLLAMLNDDGNSGMTYAIPSALKDINDPEIIPMLLELLGAEKEWVRAVAARALGGMGGPSHALQVLNTALDSSDASVKIAVVEALGKLGDPVALPYLMSALDDFPVQNEAVNALSRLGKAASPAIPKIIKIIKNKKSWGRSSAVRCLGEIGNADTAIFLIEILKEKDLSFDAADAVGDLIHAGEKINVHKFGKVILSEKVLDYVRWRLVYYLRNIKDPDVVPYLIQALEDKSPNMRSVAMLSLETIGDPRAVPKLIECLDDTEFPIYYDNEPGEPVSKAAESALLAIGHPDGLRAIEDRRKRNEQYE
jgi:HEAT repeat protein